MSEVRVDIDRLVVRGEQPVSRALIEDIERELSQRIARDGSGPRAGEALSWSTRRGGARIADAIYKLLAAHTDGGPRGPRGR